MKQSDKNHLRRLVAWVRLELGQTPEELEITMRDIANKLGHPDIDDAAKERLVLAHDKARSVPQYVRSAVKALEKHLGGSGQVIDVPDILQKDKLTQQDADNVEAQPSIHPFAGYDPNFNPGSNPESPQMEQPDPAMAGDDLTDKEIIGIAACFPAMLDAHRRELLLFADALLKRVQPARGEDDPLQGAANWLLKALSKCDVDDIQCQLIIGHNRAKRLLDAAMKQERKL